MENHSDHSEQILTAITEIRDLVRLMAEPQIAARDEKLRTTLLDIAGRSTAHQKSVLLMDGHHTQKQIFEKTGVHQGNLSTLVKRLSASNLLTGDPKKPKLAIPVPSNFFEKNGKK